MAALNDPRWEMFCIGVVRGKSQRQSYVDAGYTSAGATNATTLAKRPEIRARIAELIEEKTQFQKDFVNGPKEHEDEVANAMIVGVSEGWVIKTLMEIIKKAQEVDQFAAATSAVKLLGDMQGMFNKKDAAQQNDKPAQQTVIEDDRVTKLIDHFDTTKFTEKKKAHAGTSPPSD